MSKYKIILLDIDDTILDFKKCEVNAITKTICNYGISATEELTNRYSEINQSLWKAFERKEITKPELLTKRFEMFFNPLGVYENSEEINKVYLDYLSNETFLIPGAIELLEALKEYKVYVVTNAVARVQNSRLSKAGLYDYFDDVFVSELIGYQKPDVRFYNDIYKLIGSPRKEDIIVLGDSLSSDIQGGINFGVDTCWFNPHHKKSDSIKANYEIDNLLDFLKIIEK